MTLSRKHFKEIAEILAKNNATPELIKDFSGFCKRDNSLFDMGRFISYIAELKEQQQAEIKAEQDDIKEQWESQQIEAQ
jgi:hypothetical protein